jgi:hypothetical protein
MKTTVEISDPLLQEAREVAARENTTLRALIESGLREVLDRRKRSTRFRLRDASVKGTGLRPEFRDANWARIREESYKRSRG